MSPHRFAFSVAVAVLTGAWTSGCVLFERPGEGPAAQPITKGTWTGKIIEMPVRFSDGTERIGVALEVISGPEPRTWFARSEGIEMVGPDGRPVVLPPGSSLRFEIPPERGSGRLPIILRGNRSNPETSLVSPSELPVGAVVELSGNMMLRPSGFSRTSALTQEDMAASTTRRYQSWPEHVVVITRRPSVIKNAR